MNKQTLINAIRNSGSGQNALDEAPDLWARIDYLQQTGRYGALPSPLRRANDKNNFLALMLEVNFAYQFESRGRELVYKVKQDARQKARSTCFANCPAERVSFSSFAFYNKHSR